MQDAPIPPRVPAVAIWTGEEVLFLGGDTDPCPASASCVTPTVAPLADGAALDPSTGAWRRIADAPIGFTFADAELVDDTVYVWAYGEPDRPGAPTAFLAYNLETDRWRRLELPPRAKEMGDLVVAGSRIVTNRGTDEGGSDRVAAYDLAGNEWTVLPDDPLTRGYARKLVWTDDDLQLLDHALPVDPTVDPPTDPPLRTAAFDFTAGSWRRLPDRTEYPSGAYTIDNDFAWPESDPELEAAWKTLEDPPAGQEDFGVGAFATALLTTTGAWYFRHSGWAYDAPQRTWFAIPPLEQGRGVEGRLYAGAGRDLVAFGGFDWTGDEIELLKDAWIWSRDAP